MEEKQSTFKGELGFVLACSLGFGIWSGFTVFSFSILDFLDFFQTALCFRLSEC